MPLSSIESKIEKLHNIEVRITFEASIDNKVFIKSSINSMHSISGYVVEEKSSPVKRATLNSYISILNPITSTVDNN
jgi:soluble P-type ATPase